MIVVTNTAAQTLQPGQSLIFNAFNKTVNGCESFRQNTNSVRLKCSGIYEATFSGNVSSETAATPVSLALTLSGFVLPETTMTSTPSEANVFNNVSSGTYIKACCGDFDRVAVTNVGTTPVTVAANANLRIIRNS